MSQLAVVTGAAGRTWHTDTEVHVKKRLFFIVLCYLMGSSFADPTAFNQVVEVPTQCQTTEYKTVAGGCKLIL